METLGIYGKDKLQGALESIEELQTAIIDLRKNLESQENRTESQIKELALQNGFEVQRLETQFYETIQKLQNELLKKTEIIQTQGKQIDQLTKSLKSMKENVGVLENLIQIHKSQSEEKFEKLRFSEKPTEPTIQVNEEDTKVESDEPSENETIYLEIKEKGNKLFATEFYNDAIEIYLSAIPYSKDDNSIIYGNICACYLKLNDYEKAKEYGVKSTSDDPCYAKGWCRLGQAYMKLNDFTEAERVFNNCLELEPANVVALRGLKELEKIQENTEANPESLPDILNPENLKKVMETEEYKSFLNSALENQGFISQVSKMMPPNVKKAINITKK